MISDRKWTAERRKTALESQRIRETPEKRGTDMVSSPVFAGYPVAAVVVPSGTGADKVGLPSALGRGLPQG
jgi:hypothetical protein